MQTNLIRKCFMLTVQLPLRGGVVWGQLAAPPTVVIDPKVQPSQHYIYRSGEEPRHPSARVPPYQLSTHC